MLSWTDMQSQFQDMAIDTTAATLTFGKRNMNIGVHLLESEVGSFVTEDTRTGSTSSSTDVVNLPENCIRIKTFYVTVGSVRYVADEVYDEDSWQALKSYAAVSNVITKMFRRRNTLEIYPKPASTNTWTMIYELESKDLYNADYQAGTLTSLANLGTAAVGSGTTWTTAMIGRFLQVTADQQWYEISAVADTTHLTLKVPYQGVTISPAATYRIGEMARTPGPTHHIPVYFALWQYFEGVKKDAKFGPLYKNQYEQYMQWAKATYGRRYSSAVIPSQRQLKKGVGLINPNLFPTNLS